MVAPGRRGPAARRRRADACPVEGRTQEHAAQQAVEVEEKPMELLAAVNWLHYVFMIPLGMLSVFLILVILVQRGRGGGLTGALGGMGGQSAFGTKAGDVFTRITIVLAAIWILLSLTALKVLNQQSTTAGLNPNLRGAPLNTSTATPPARTPPTGSTPPASTPSSAESQDATTAPAKAPGTTSPDATPAAPSTPMAPAAASGASPPPASPAAPASAEPAAPAPPEPGKAP
jgi:preprotein translocase subunit SecG